MFSRIIAFAAVIFLIKQLLYPFYRPVKSEQKKRIRKYHNEKHADEKARKRREQKLKIAKTFAIRLPFMQSEADLRKTLDRLNLNKRPEEIWLEQNLWLLGGTIGAIIMFSANNILGLLSILFIPLGFFIPTDELDKEVKRKNKNIALDFPQFYCMVFYQYSKTINIYLADVINDYLPNANDDMAEELSVMLRNIDYADEEYALKQLKKRVPIHHIIKFCDIMETRLHGYDNISQMQYLKNEIDRYRVTELENELARRAKTNNMIQITLILILGAYIIIYYMFTIMGSMSIFM
jgi:Flp pilus assembly protein TadB